MKRMILTRERLKELLHYDPQTGVFIWAIKPNRRIRIGETAGCVKGRGYAQVRIFDADHYAHRLAWLYMTGEWPKLEIDHVNGIRNDNRWVNLREATRSINQQNERKPRANNVTGFLGVCPAGDSFQAQIKLRGKNIYLGLYLIPEQAHGAYLKAKRRLHEGCTI